MSPDINKINAVLRKSIDDLLLHFEFESNINEQLRSRLAHLTEIDLVYSQTEDQLYQTTANQIQEVPLLKFEAELFLSQLIEKYFKKLALFRQAYEIAILRSKKDKYHHLEINEPLVQATIPIPYECPPLSQAKFISDAVCYNLDQQQVQQVK